MNIFSIFMNKKILLAILIVMFVIGFVYFIRISQKGFSGSSESSGSVSGSQ